MQQPADRDKNPCHLRCIRQQLDKYFCLLLQSGIPPHTGEMLQHGVPIGRGIAKHNIQSGDDDHGHENRGLQQQGQ